MTAASPVILQSPAPVWKTLGQSVEGREIRVCLETGALGATRGGTLLIGGLHGDETATISLLERFGMEWLGRGAFAQAVAVLPLANPDSRARDSRYNAHGVDLNRNCAHRWSAQSVEPSGPAPWSEPEICALRDFILEWQPRAVVALHWALAEIDADGAQSRPLAEAMWQALSPEQQAPYRWRVSESGAGEPEEESVYTACPGSLGQWCGFHLRYEDGTRPAMITLELPYDETLNPRPEHLPEDHLETLRALWTRDRETYLQAIWPGVELMLLAACRLLPTSELIGRRI